MKSLHEVPNLNSILLDETRNVTNDIQNYIDLHNINEEASLKDHPLYLEAIYGSCNYLTNLIDAQKEKHLEIAQKLMKQTQISDLKISDFCKEFTDIFLSFYQIAERFYSVTTTLEEKAQNELENIDSNSDSSRWEVYHQKVVEYKNRKIAIHKALAAYAVNIFRKLSNLTGINRTILLKETEELRVTLASFVNYRNYTDQTILSSWNGYAELCKGASAIALIEMSERFDNAHKRRIDTISKLITLNNEQEKNALLLDLSKLYNALFIRYSGVETDTFEFKYVLVNHYTMYLEEFLKLGSIVNKTIFNVDIRCKTWYKCLPLITSLGYDSRVSEKKKIEWNKLSTNMTQIIKDFTNN